MPTVPLLVLGPLLRYVGDTEATIWVETDSACEVQVLDSTSRTFEVEGHHYALLYVENLEPGSVTPYTVSLDGEQCWPETGDPFPPPVIRTPKEDEHIRMVWGSCRVAVPHEPPFSDTKDTDPRGREIDALYAYALRIRSGHQGLAAYSRRHAAEVFQSSCTSWSSKIIAVGTTESSQRTDGSVHASQYRKQYSAKFATS